MSAATVTLHRAPSAGFDRPYEMLAACHERVARMVGLLERLAVHVQSQGADAQARDAARDVMRYFDIASPLHHQDEERHVFPRLRAQGQGALADRLCADHEAMVPAWAAVRAALLEITQGRVPPEAAHGAWDGFIALYRRHAAEEEAIAYPVAVAATSADEARAMGAEMSARRGL